MKTEPIHIEGDVAVATSQNRAKIIATKTAARFTETSHGFIRGWGVSGRLSGAKAISMAYGSLPAHMIASPHSHEFDTAIFILSGCVRAFFGDDLVEFVDVEAGDFLFIPAKLMHCPANMRDKPMEYLVARATAIED